MESTGKILDNMDGAAFEKLCGQVLRKMIPEVANLIPSGINVEGRTIKSLSDGFCFIDRNQFATIHITTNTSNLRKKWLYNGEAKTTPRGDLIKGIEQAREMFAENPNYKFTIFLVSNSRVDDELYFEVNHSIVDDFIKVRIVEQRDLIPFLDHDPEGQYLRKYFLGIDADRISLSLLRDIAKDNLDRYRREIYLEEAYLANVSSQKMIEVQMSTSMNRINLLIADSGFGKSTLCFAIIRSVIRRGGVSLRLKASTVEKAISFEDAIQQQLMNDYPKLFILPTDIQTLFQDTVIVIDDINKSDNATALLDKIISWNQVKQPGTTTVLCPVWPRNLATLDNKTKKDHKFTVISLQRLSFYDCKTIIEQRIESGLPQLTDQQIHSLIIDTGFDPLLLDFSLQLLSNSHRYTENIAGEAVKNYVSDKVQQVHKLNQSPVYLINQCLVLLGKEMLKNRKLDPHFQDIEKWIGRGSEEYRIIIMIAAQQQLFYFDDEGMCFFRHDRVRDHFLSMGAAELLEDYFPNEDVLADPYYSEIVGAALAIATVPKDIFEALLKSNPLSVYHSLKYLQEDSSESRLATVIEVIHAWNSSENIKYVPKAVINAISSALMGFDVKQIDGITQGFRDSAELQLAKFRNGVWLSGVNFFSFMDYFYPEAPTYWWNSILRHVEAKYLDHTIEGLQSFLPERFTEKGIVHAYTLAGFLRAPKLLEALTASWKINASPQNYVAYLWAILNSFTKNDRLIVIDALLYWSTISPEVKAHPLGEKLSSRRISEQLKVLNWDFSEEQLALLIDLSTDTNLNEILALLFAKIDHPMALKIVLDQEMQRDESRHWYDQWDERWDRVKTKRALSEQSLNYLFTEFTNVTSNPIRRYVAWRYWKGNVDSNIALQKVQGIFPEEDYLFQEVILWRANHHDRTALPALQKYIARKTWLVRLLDNIWNEEACAFFEQWLIQRLYENDKDSIEYGLELLALLDNEDACRLLINYWDRFKQHPRAIVTALFLSTQATKSLADKQIRRLGFEPSQPLPDYYHGNIRGLYFSEGDSLSEEKRQNLLLLAEQFKYFHMHYGNKYEGRAERLTREKLENLLPYLPLFDSHSIYDFAQDSLRIGAPDLCYEKFYPLLDNHLRKRFRLTADDLIQDIISKFRELERENKVSIDHWIKDAEKLGVTNEMLYGGLQSFFQQYHNANAFFIGSIILETLGTRKSIALMDDFLLDSEAQRQNVEYWKANAVFSIKRRSIH